MKYVINRENYKKFPLFEVNKCEGRAYFIPYSNRETLAATSCLEERYKSDLVSPIRRVGFSLLRQGIEIATAARHRRRSLRPYSSAIRLATHRL